MKYYISDLHFGHSNIIKHDGRPFDDVDEMDKAMISLWNSRVQKNDEVYVVGDFCFRSGKSPAWYLEQLKGIKYLILGNHDDVILNDGSAKNYFAEIDKIMTIKDEDRRIVLCHYPLAEWDRMKHGSYHIYGHIHNRKDEAYMFMKDKDRAYNAAVAINNYMPVTFSELERNNRFFNEG